MNRRRSSRRAVLAAWFGAAAAGIGGRGWHRLARWVSVRSRPGDAALVAVCSGPLHDPRIGAACLRALPADQRSPARLARLMLHDLSARMPDRISAAALHGAIQDRSRADFGEGRIASVDGWMLSLTEIRAYALAALIAGRRPVRLAERARLL